MLNQAETVEGIRFGSFDSIKMGLYLIDREAPTPEEKEIIEDIPFMQGNHDFSFLLGERIFNNRLITYTFKAFKVKYGTRKNLENEIKSQVMAHSKLALYDSHELGYHWFGKCRSIKVSDNQRTNTLTATLEFNCYPFLLTSKIFYDDLWDEFNFQKDVACFSRYQIQNSREILIINNGSTTISPLLHGSAAFELSLAGAVHSLPAGYGTNLFLRLKRGLNYLHVRGNGQLTIFMNKELMG